MAKDSQVRVAITTKQVINKVAALVQLETGASVTADLAIRVALEKAFPELAKEMGINTKKELKDKES